MLVEACTMDIGKGGSIMRRLEPVPGQLVCQNKLIDPPTYFVYILVIKLLRFSVEALALSCKEIISYCIIELCMLL